MVKEMIPRPLPAKASLHLAYEENASLRARIAALEAQLAVVRKALEEISEPETVWRRRAAEDGIRLAATDIAALTRERTPEVIARTALRKLGGRNVD